MRNSAYKNIRGANPNFSHKCSCLSVWEIQHMRISEAQIRIFHTSALVCRYEKFSCEFEFQIEILTLRLRLRLRPFLFLAFFLLDLLCLSESELTGDRLSLRDRERLLRFLRDRPCSDSESENCKTKIETVIITSLQGGIR